MSERKIDGRPAFPCEWDYIGSTRAAANGMTLRDYFAAKALPPLVAKYEGQPGNPIPETVAAAYAYADAMLKAREE